MTSWGGDLSKQLYKFQEGISAVALEVAGTPKARVLWPAAGRPTGLTVDVDILVGKDAASATLNISIKHGTSEKNSEFSGWRMLREIFDSKANCKGVTIVNVFFDDSVKDDWSRILASFFDGFLVLSEQDEYGPVLIGKAYEYARGALKGLSDAEARDLLSKAMDRKSSTFDSRLYIAAKRYGTDLKRLGGRPNAGLDGFWRIVRTSCSRSIPSIAPRNTAFKRGLAKLLIFEPSYRTKVYEWAYQRKPIDSLPTYSYSLGLASEGIDETWEIIDADILSLFALFPSGSGELFEGIFRCSPVATMNQKYIQPLREVSNVVAFSDYVVRNYSALCTTRGMQRALTRCFADPMRLLAGYEIVGEERSVWLFTTLMALFKAAGGTSQSYGISMLAADAGLPEVGRLGGLIISPFVSRSKPLSRESLTRISAALASRLAQSKIADIADLENEIRRSFVQRLLETQLIPYKLFDPIGVLLKGKLDTNGIPWTHHARYKTLANEYAGARGGGATKVLEIQGRTPSLVMWQSPNKNARDKAKEFSARIACLVTKYDRKRKSFASRGYKVFMVLDGVWDAEDIRSLLRFGCEKVFYPDELDQLLAEVK